MFKKIFSVAMVVGALLLSPAAAFAQFENGDIVVRNPTYGYSVAVPKYWIYDESEHTALSGGTIGSIVVTQQGDLASRPAKWFYLYVGSPSSVFNLSTKVAQKLSPEELINFYLDQNYNQSIDYSVTKTYIKNDGSQKVYVVESNYLVPGSYRVMSTTYFEFRNGKVYQWGEGHFVGFESHVPVLQGMISSLQIK